MLMRHGNRIKVGLTKIPSSYLRFQRSDKLQTLETVGEGYQKKENADIPVSELDDPIYLAKTHTAEHDFKWSDMEAIQANPYGYFTFPEVTGYILNIKLQLKNMKATTTIIEKYVS